MIVLAGDILQNVLYRAVQDTAKVVQSLSGNVLIML